MNFGMDINKHNWWTDSTRKHTSSLNCRLISGDWLLIRYTIHTIPQLWFLAVSKWFYIHKCVCEVWGKLLGKRLRFAVMETKLHYWHTNSETINPNVIWYNPVLFCKVYFNIIFSLYNNSNGVFLSLRIIGIKITSTQPCIYYIIESYIFPSQ